MKFANLVAVASIQRTQTGGPLSLLSFFPCRGPYISFWSLVRPGLRLTDFYCLILTNMQLRLDTLSSSHNYFCGNTKIYCFLRADWFFGLRVSTLWEPESWYVLYHDGRLQDTFSKNISFDDPQNGGHFSCRKPVSHVGTSTVHLFFKNSPKTGWTFWTPRSRRSRFNHSVRTLWWRSKTTNSTGMCSTHWATLVATALRAGRSVLFRPPSKQLLKNTMSTLFTCFDSFESWQNSIEFHTSQGRNGTAAKSGMSRIWSRRS